MSKWTYIMVPAFTMSPWKVAGLNHSTCNVYYKMSHLQQTYMAWLQVWRISDLLNSKPFVNSSKTAIKCVARHIHLGVHINEFIYTNETKMVDPPPDMPAKGELLCKIDTTSTRSMTPIASTGFRHCVH
jgi:hypothetical protein